MATIRIVNSHLSQDVFFLFCTTSSCVCRICVQWVAIETTPIADWHGATFGSVCIKRAQTSVFVVCPQWVFHGMVTYNAVPTEVKRAMLFQHDKQRTSYPLDNGTVMVTFTYPPLAAPPPPSKNLLLGSRCDSPLFFLFCTTSSCACHVCQQWTGSETHPLVDQPGWTYGVLQVNPHQSKVKAFCPQWSCIGACYLAAMPPQIVKSLLDNYDVARKYTLGGGQALLDFTHHVKTASTAAAAIPLTVDQPSSGNATATAGDIAAVAEINRRANQIAISAVSGDTYRYRTSAYNASNAYSNTYAAAIAPFLAASGGAKSYPSLGANPMDAYAKIYQAALARYKIPGVGGSQQPQSTGLDAYSKAYAAALAQYQIPGLTAAAPAAGEQQGVGIVGVMERVNQVNDAAQVVQTAVNVATGPGAQIIGAAAGSCVIS